MMRPPARTSNWLVCPGVIVAVASVFASMSAARLAARRS
jgi:hypothetical protein